ncbi:Nitroreductase [Neocallimastix lanati (nom. inval.)]|nr:Nitroreductase [Neocallimastix sp. JGI-2020a]
MKNKINEIKKVNMKNVLQEKDLQLNETSKKYKRIVLLSTKVTFYIIIISFLVYKKPFEKELQEKNKEIENIKRHLNKLIIEKDQLYSKIQIQNNTLQNQIFLLRNQNSKYENDIILNKSINNELNDQLKSYQKDLKNKNKEFQHKSDIFMKQITNFEDIINKYKKEINEKEFIINSLRDRINVNVKELQEIKSELLKNNSTLLLNLRGGNYEENKLSFLDKEYFYDKNFYNKYNMVSNETFNKLGYSLIFQTHSLEKGLSHFKLRPFGKEKIKAIIRILKAELKYNNHERHFYFINGINALREYKKIYEKYKWIKRSEYKIVSRFLKYYRYIEEQKTGAYILTKEELKNDYSIDYKKFIKSRHSTRNYKNLKLKFDDIKKAVEMAKYSPSACNRQYIKLHYYPTGKMKQNVIDYSIGKSGLYLEGVNTFIITFDVNGLRGVGERNQGYFNAGLFSTNLVNAFHSLGIGTCFIQFNNSSEQEEKLKKINDIPSNERIAVILYAGYYDDKSIFARSPRREFEDYFMEHK